MTSNVVAVDNDQKLSKYAIYALAFGLIGNALDFMDWQFLANVAPVITKEFGFSSNTMALLLGAPFIGVGVGGMFGGWVSDRIGRVKTMALCMAWFSIFTVIFPSCNGFTSMFIFRILAGIGLGALWGVIVEQRFFHGSPGWRFLAVDQGFCLVDLPGLECGHDLCLGFCLGFGQGAKAGKCIAKTLDSGGSTGGRVNKNVFILFE